GSFMNAVGHYNFVNASVGPVDNSTTVAVQPCRPGARNANTAQHGLSPFTCTQPYVQLTDAQAVSSRPALFRSNTRSARYDERTSGPDTTSRNPRAKPHWRYLEKSAGGT